MMMRTRVTQQQGKMAAVEKPVLYESEASSLVVACARTIGRSLHRFVADQETVECFSLLPPEAIETISEHAIVTARNVELLTMPDVRRLVIRGDVEDDALATAVFPRRSERALERCEDWIVADVSLGLRGCIHVRDLTLDVPVTRRFFRELCRALPELARLALGDRCDPDAVKVVLDDLPNLHTLDLTRATWFDALDFAAAAKHAPACSRFPPRALAPLELVCRADCGPRRDLCPPSAATQVDPCSRASSSLGPTASPAARQRAAATAPSLLPRGNIRRRETSRRVSHQHLPSAPGPRTRQAACPAARPSRRPARLACLAAASLLDHISPCPEGVLKATNIRPHGDTPERTRRALIQTGWGTRRRLPRRWCRSWRT